MERDNAVVMIGTGNNLKHILWCIRCSAHSGNLLAHNVIGEK